MDFKPPFEQIAMFKAEDISPRISFERRRWCKEEIMKWSQNRRFRFRRRRRLKEL